jgi:hypothetical protein
VEDFTSDRTRKDGYHPYCRICSNLRQRESYREGGARWRSVALANARRRAEIKGLDFDLTHDDLVIPDICPILGIPLYFGRKKYLNNSPALDRINNALGYVKGNVIVISWRANRIKSDATLDELRAITVYYEGLK